MNGATFRIIARVEKSIGDRRWVVELDTEIGSVEALIDSSIGSDAFSMSPSARIAHLATDLLLSALSTMPSTAAQEDSQGTAPTGSAA